MLRVIRVLSQEIGGRGSCTPNERKAGELIAEQLRSSGVQDVSLEDFLAVPSTYWPYGLAFGLALTGSISSLLFDGMGSIFLGALLNALGFVGMLAETDLKPSWLRWFLPRLKSQNVVGHIPAKSQRRSAVLLCAHLDSHRTPIFYSSSKWLKAFNMLIGLTLLSMGVGAIGYSLGLVMGWSQARWLGIGLIPIQLFALAMCLHADFTPYSPGANDNASGAAVVMAVAEHLKETPLANLEVHFAFTGCEEVGTWGMQAYLHSHASDLGDHSFTIVLDQVGSGRIKFLTSDGLLIRHKTHSEALDLAREAASRLPDIVACSGAGVAYTDALAATQRGLAALTVCAVPEDGAESASAHWHQMSDTFEQIKPDDLENIYRFTWETLKIVNERG